MQAIAHLARAMNLVTVAEYVETDEIRLRIATLGVDYGQGFAIARPSALDLLIGELPMYASAQGVGGAEPVLAPDSGEIDARELRVAGAG